LETAARASGIEPFILPADSERNIDAAFASFVQQGTTQRNREFPNTYQGRFVKEQGISTYGSLVSNCHFGG